MCVVCTGIKKKEAKKKSQVKHVVEQRNRYVKELLGGKMSKSTCPHCKMRSRPLRTELQSKVFFASGMDRKQAMKVLSKRKELAEQRLG